MLKKENLLNQKGSMLVMTLVFTLLFTITAIGLSSMVVLQHKLGSKKTAWAKALSAAEAGINYYRWHLAHAPEDYQDGTNQPGPYIHEYKDNSGNVIGYFSLNITPPSSCSSSLTIESTGWTKKEPNTRRKIKVKYGKSSLAKFAFLTNSNVWFGSNENLHGPIHSNGGIRMDGHNNAQTTSAKKTYICGPEHGCWYETKPGIWGDGGDQNLWTYPVSNIDFDSITTDLATLKNLAKNASCGNNQNCYFPENGLGYHIKFKNDGTFDLYHVTKLYNSVWSYDGANWIKTSDDIKQENFIANYTIPNECGIIFVEDDLWVEGTVKGKTTVVAAKLPDTGNNPKIIINGNLLYSYKNGNNELALISQSNIYVPLYAAPSNLEIDAVLLAQKGRVMRKFYALYGWKRVPWSARTYVIRQNLNLYGAIISNLVWTWSWVNSWGMTISGYENTQTDYDPNLNYNPPPGFPTTGEYKFLRWEETTEK